jgi:glucose-6-phosphate 1-epimerase
MDISSLRSRFAVPGVIAFQEQNGLVRLDLTTPIASASLFLQGAHLTHWQPAEQSPVIFLSRKSEFAAGKPIRGGIPIVFPWFATDSKQDRVDGHPGPSHGFARLQDWTLESITRSDADTKVKLTLGPTEMSRSMGFASFLLTLEFIIGRSLSVTLTATNTGTEPFSYEEAFHSYFRVEDVHEAQVAGLEPTGYIDKIDAFRPKPASGAPIRFTGPVDRVYQDTEAICTLRSGSLRRDIQIAKTNSRTTVVWNPGKALPDVGEWDWHEFVCVETVNAAANARSLAPGASSSMRALITVKPWSA